MNDNEQEYQWQKKGSSTEKPLEKLRNTLLPKLISGDFRVDF